MKVTESHTQTALNYYRASLTLSEQESGSAKDIFSMLVSSAFHGISLMLRLALLHNDTESMTCSLSPGLEKRKKITS